MTWTAFRMLTGNRDKYLAIIFGVAFATLLIAQQSSIFCGLMLLTTSQIRDIQGANIWVMDPNVQFERARVLQVIYEIDSQGEQLYVGQQLDVFIEFEQPDSGKSNDVRTDDGRHGND